MHKPQNNVFEHGQRRRSNFVINNQKDSPYITGSIIGAGHQTSKSLMNS